MFIAELKKTNNYSMFEAHPYNRDITRTGRLEQSMNRHQFDPGFPIRCIEIVGGTLRITHGHHRFYVARKLGLEIYYIVVETDIDLFSSESTLRSWSLIDYITARERAGESPAAGLVAFAKENNLAISTAVSLLAGEDPASNNKIDSVKNGTFKIKELSAPGTKLLEIIALMRGLEIPGCTRVNLLSALYKCLMVPQFDDNIFKHKLNMYKDMLIQKGTMIECLDMIEAIHNKQNKSKIPLAFLAREGALQRQKLHK